MTDEINILKSEITRLNRIISVLLRQISALEAENNVLKSEKGIQISNDTVPDYYKGIKSNIDTAPISEKGTRSGLNTFPPSEKGIQSELGTVPTSEKGIQPELNTIPTIGKGIKTDFNTDATTGSTPKTGLGNAPVNLAAHIEADTTNVIKLAKHLRQFLPATKQHHALSIIARELLLLYNASRASSHELRKAAGLSKPGFAKHLPKLKRRGLIANAPPLKYKLTDYSREMIEKVFG